MSDPAWTTFLRDAGGPIGTTGAWILAISFAILLVVLTVRACTPSDTEASWDTACALAEGKRHKMGGDQFCVKFEIIDTYPIYDLASWKQGCINIGGEAKTRNSVTACRKVTVIRELGARDDYTGGQN